MTVAGSAFVSAILTFLLLAFIFSFFRASELMRGYVGRPHLPSVGNSFAPIALTREKVVEVFLFRGLSPESRGLGPSTLPEKYQLTAFHWRSHAQLLRSGKVPDSKTPNGITGVPLTPLAVEGFRNQLAISGPGPFLFPSDLNPTGHQRTLNTTWQKTLRWAGVPYFRIYDLARRTQPD